MDIYIIEDDFGVRDSLVELVEGLGHSALAFPDGESFMREAEPRPEDVVFVDLGLPGINGIDVIRALHLGKRPPRIIVISGQPRRDIARALEGAPDIPLLRKPLRAEELADFL